MSSRARRGLGIEPCPPGAYDLRRCVDARPDRDGAGENIEHRGMIDDVLQLSLIGIGLCMQGDADLGESRNGRFADAEVAARIERGVDLCGDSTNLDPPGGAVIDEGAGEAGS